MARTAGAGTEHHQSGNLRAAASVAPKTAAAVREAVNSHPILSKIIQFNTMLGPAAMIGKPQSSPIPTQPTPVSSP
jgi:hypothetical protein